MQVADHLRVVDKPPAPSELVHYVCPRCVERAPVPMLALCGVDVTDDVRDDESPVSCDDCARIAAAIAAGAVGVCPGCHATIGRI